MPELTREQKEEYIKEGGVKCPFCGSYEISAYDQNFESTIMWQKVECDECGREWNDVYTLTAIEMDMN